MFCNCPALLLEDLRLRWERAQDALPEGGALLASVPANLFWLTGRVYRGFAFLPKRGEPLFLVRRPVDLRGENVLQYHRPEELQDLLPKDCTLLLEDCEISHAEFKRISLFAKVSEGGSSILRRSRSVKTPWEIEQVAASGRKQAEAFAHFPSLFVPGMTDQQFNAAIFQYMLNHGSLGQIRAFGPTMESFIGLVLAGDNGAAPAPYDYALGGAGISPALPVGQCGKVIEPGDAVLCDIPGNFNGYMSDSTRVFYRDRISDEARFAHATSIRIIEALEKECTPGANCEELYRLALSIAEEAGLAHCFMGASQKARFVGHGTGIYVNEAPVLGVRSKDILQEGMVIAIEPKFVVSGAGAVGVEDTFVVAKDGLRNLSSSPRELMPL